MKHPDSRPLPGEKLGHPEDLWIELGILLETDAEMGIDEGLDVHRG
jgi:hypothetical protein